MKKLMNFFVLVMVIFFLFSCVNKRVSTTSSQKSYKPKETRLLTADMDDALRISFPSSLVKWRSGRGGEKGKNILQGKGRIWAWRSPLKYEFYLLEDTKNLWKNKYNRYGEMGKRYYLKDSHFTEIKNRYSDYLSKSDVRRLTYDGLRKNKGFLNEGFPYISLTSEIKNPGLWKSEDIITTLFFENKNRKWCLMFLVNLDPKNSLNPVSIIKENIKVVYD